MLYFVERRLGNYVGARIVVDHIEADSAEQAILRAMEIDGIEYKVREASLLAPTEPEEG